jgi:hypothetical protein
VACAFVGGIPAAIARVSATISNTDLLMRIGLAEEVYFPVVLENRREFHRSRADGGMFFEYLQPLQSYAGVKRKSTIPVQIKQNFSFYSRKFGPVPDRTLSTTFAFVTLRILFAANQIPFALARNSS